MSLRAPIRTSSLIDNRGYKLWLWIILLISGFTHAAIAQTPDRDTTQAELQAVLTELNALDVWFSDAEQKRVRWLKDVKSKDREVANLNRRVDAADDALKSVQGSLSELNAEQTSLEIQRIEQAHRITEHLSAAYRLSGQDFLKLLLNQQSPETFERMMRYHRYFSDARMESLEAYQTTLTNLLANEEKLNLRLADRKTRQASLAKQQQALVTEHLQRKTLLASLSAQVESKTVQRKRLQADRNRLEALLAELQRRATELDGSQFASRKGTLPWPVSGTLRSRFGQKRADGRLVWHGVVLAAVEGTPVTSIFRGRVVFADWLRGFGLLTIIDHGSGYMTLYGQADMLSKTVGEWVESGETIARAGRSGGQTASGLYFEVRQQGTARDPLRWLAKRPQR
ncbi:MAG: peptidoglycan DD-metalloendopeptidase family protein [Gammaproteobacteria bacterium]|nr:peptidoglycan DD-metalloendopeptidase family protein [Gammaproteobacteria bacterium]